MMMLAVSPGFFWTLVVLTCITIVALWLESWALHRDYKYLETQREWWENYAHMLEKNAPRALTAPLPKEFDI